MELIVLSLLSGQEDRISVFVGLFLELYRESRTAEPHRLGILILNFLFLRGHRRVGEAAGEQDVAGKGP